MTGVKAVSTGYYPRKLQQYLHNSLKRFNVVACHRRFGKTVFSLNELIDKALRNQNKNPQYAYIAPTYGQAKRVSWDYLKDFTKNIPGVSYNEAELRLEIQRPSRGDKIKVWLLGAENPGTVRGIYLDGVILDEYAEMDPTIWTQVIRPALSDRKGWAIFIGTVKGRNHFHEVYHFAKNGDPKRDIAPPENWFTAMFKASETGILDPEELEAAKAEMSEEEFAQEYECDWGAALVGAYYGKHITALENDGRITKVPYDPAVPVDTWWDLGVGDSTAIWFTQKVASDYHVIDYVEMSGQGLEWYISELKKKKYVYGDINLPHDAAARDMSTGKSRVEMIRALWPSLRAVVHPRLAVEDGINAARMIIPKCYIDSEKCARGIEALRAYQKKWDAKNKIYMDKPLHDWSSHGADAFRLFAIGNKYDRSPIEARNLPRSADNTYDIFGGS